VLTIYNSGYAIAINVDGTFPVSSFYWSTGGSCTGTPYLVDYASNTGGSQLYAKTLAWSAAGDSWYATNGTATKGVVNSIEIGTSDHSYELLGTSGSAEVCNIHQSYSGTTFNATAFGGWTLTSFNPQTTLNWPAFETCTIPVNPGTNGQTGTSSAATTKTVSCLAGPLQLP
jgi:hypothetical protein